MRHALRRPGARVVGIDVSEASLDHGRKRAAHHEVANLELHRLPIEETGALGEHFDHVVCTGGAAPPRRPGARLRRLRDVLAPGGAVTLMVYARYGRAGVYLLQDYCRRLGVGTSPDEMADLVATLRELPAGHPLGRLLRESLDFADDDALADALCNPRDRAYSVPELLDLAHGGGLRIGRWERQAPYLRDCGSVSETPHGTRIAVLPPAEQYALVELFRGTITRHTAILFDAGDPTSGVLDFGDPAASRWVPVRSPTAIAVEERLPPGAAAALLDRAHTDADLVLFANRHERGLFRAIDGARTIAGLGDGAAAFVERLWRHDLVVIDACAAPSSRQHQPRPTETS